MRYYILIYSGMWYHTDGERRNTMPSERLLDLSEVVDRLKVNEKTVRKWIKEGELKASNLGHRIGFRVKESDLERFLAEKQVMR